MPEQTNEQAEYTFHGYYIPERMMGGIRRYIDHGIIPGDFLQGVIIDSLKQCVMYADDENQQNLVAYAGYFYNVAPMTCWGSRDVMAEWHAHRGMENIHEQT